jgi:hypothetical protein
MHNRLRLTAIAATTLLMTGAVASTTASAAPDRAPSTSSVVNARISGHCSFDRIVVDVKGNLPPAAVKRVSELRSTCRSAD